jgi:hypothetical protein
MRQRRRYTIAMSLAWFATVATLLASTARAEHWELLYREGNVRVWEDTDAERATFKAESVIDAHLFDVLAVLSDTARRPQWVGDLDESRIVAGDIQTKVVIYERFHLPWPLDDRDSMVESVITQNLKQLEVAVHYREVTHPKAPPRDGVTRMPVVRGSMFFRYVDKQHAFARIVMTLDVGGMLPDFAVQRFVRKGPARTLEGLVRQVGRTRGRYAAFVQALVELARVQAVVPFEPPG